MPLWKGIVGRAFSTEEFDDYCHSLSWNQWRPRFVVLHNTSFPSLADRPNGFTTAHMAGFVHYYRDEKQWSAGPHLFVDDHQIWVFTPLTVSGIHSPAWNSLSIGVEMLGNYEIESFSSGRGLQVKYHTISALRTLHSVLGIDPNKLKFHKEDPYTTHADCPGRYVSKSEIMQSLNTALASLHGGEHMI